MVLYKAWADYKDQMTYISTFDLLNSLVSKLDHPNLVNEVGLETSDEG